MPAGDYVAYGQCDLSNSAAAGVSAFTVLQVNGSGVGSLDGVTIPAFGETEASDQDVAHLAAPGSISNGCSFGPNGQIMSNTITAIKVGVASP